MHGGGLRLLEDEGGGSVADGGVAHAVALARLGVLEEAQPRSATVHRQHGLQQHSDRVPPADRVAELL